MGKKTVLGLCHVCGAYAALSREHVPPRTTPNKNTYIELTFDQATRVGPEDVPKGPKRQGGVWFHTLCGRCNNTFGRWYVPELNRWYWGGDYLLRRVLGDAAAFSARNVYPLRIIKAVVAMFFSVNPERFRSTPTGAALARLLLDQHAKGLPEGVRFYTYFNHTGQLRYLPILHSMNVITGKVYHVSEITYPPFGFVMALDSESPDPRLFDASHFADFDYEELATVDVALAALPTFMGWIPTDYRPLGDINRQAQAGVEESIRQGVDPKTI